MKISIPVIKGKFEFSFINLLKEILGGQNSAFWAQGFIKGKFEFPFINL